MSKHQSRKYRLTWGVLILATFLTAIGKMDGFTWATVAGGISGWYHKINVDQKKMGLEAETHDQS